MLSFVTVNSKISPIFLTAETCTCLTIWDNIKPERSFWNYFLSKNLQKNESSCIKKKLNAWAPANVILYINIIHEEFFKKDLYKSLLYRNLVGLPVTKFDFKDINNIYLFIEILVKELIDKNELKVSHEKYYINSYQKFLDKSSKGDQMLTTKEFYHYINPLEDYQRNNHMRDCIFKFAQNIILVPKLSKIAYKCQYEI